MEQLPLFDDLPLPVAITENEATDAITFRLGLADAAALVNALGGLSIKVPKGRGGSDYARLETALGCELAQKVVSIFGGEMLYIPKQQAAKLRLKHLTIRQRYTELVAGGESRIIAAQRVALEFDITERHVLRILAN